jgi:hypothetical protein
VATLDRMGRVEPRVTNWRSAAPIAPVWRIKARVARPANVLSFDQVNYVDDLIDRGLYSSLETYRAGHIVWMADGSQWLYINEIPASGQAIPVGTDGNAYWQRMQPAMDASSIRYLDGRTVQELQPVNPGATRNVPAQLLQDGVFLDEFWSYDGLTRVFEYLPSPSGLALEIPFEAGVENFTTYAGVAERYFEFEPGKRIFVRLIANTAGGMLAGIFEGEYMVFDGDDVIVDGEYADADWNLQIAIEWFTATPTYISRTIIASQAPGAGDIIINGDAEPPAGAFMGRLLVGHESQTGKVGSWAVWSPWVAEHQPSADVTADNAPIMNSPSDQVIEAEPDGTIKTGQLPRPLRFTRSRGLTNTTLLANWTAEFTNCSGTIDNSSVSADRGLVSVTAMSANDAQVKVTSLIDNVPLEKVVKLTKNRATASTPAGSGGSPVTAATFDISGEVSNTAFSSSDPYGEAVVVVAASEDVTMSASLSYYPSDSQIRLAGKFQTSPAGTATWTDAGSEVLGTTSQFLYYEPIPGSIDVSQVASGLAAGNYDVRFLLRKYSGAGTSAYIYGNIIISVG